MKYKDLPAVWKQISRKQGSLLVPALTVPPSSQADSAASKQLHCGFRWDSSLSACTGLKFFGGAIADKARQQGSAVRLCPGQRAAAPGFCMGGRYMAKYTSHQPKTWLRISVMAPGSCWIMPIMREEEGQIKVMLNDPDRAWGYCISPCSVLFRI